MQHQGSEYFKSHPYHTYNSITVFFYKMFLLVSLSFFSAPSFVHSLSKWTVGFIGCSLFSLLSHLCGGAMASPLFLRNRALPRKSFTQSVRRSNGVHGEPNMQKCYAPPFSYGSSGVPGGCSSSRELQCILKEIR
jgi:hypothetical protein